MATAVGTMVVIQVGKYIYISGLIHFSALDIIFFHLLSKWTANWGLSIQDRVELVQLVCLRRTFMFLISHSNGHDGIGRFPKLVLANLWLETPL